MEKKRVTVLVAGQRFNILTDKEEKYVIDIASKIDARITSLAISGNMTREKAAVLMALDFADDGEADKQNLEEVKQQIKDYLAEIERLGDDNAALTAANGELQAEITRLTEEKKMLMDNIKTLENSIRSFRESVATVSAPVPADEVQQAEEEAAPDEEQPAAATAEEAAPATPAEQITAEDDLFFDVPEEPKPVKSKKNRHEHRHVNPYKQQFMSKQNEQKGYTQQRQYSLFDTDE